MAGAFLGLLWNPQCKATPATFPPRRHFNGPACSCDLPFHLFGWVQASTWLWAGLGGVGFFFGHGPSVVQTAQPVSNNHFRGL